MTRFIVFMTMAFALAVPANAAPRCGEALNSERTRLNEEAWELGGKLLDADGYWRDPTLGEVQALQPEEAQDLRAAQTRRDNYVQPRCYNNWFSQNKWVSFPLAAITLGIATSFIPEGPWFPVVSYDGGMTYGAGADFRLTERQDFGFTFAVEDEAPMAEIRYELRW